VTSVPAAAGTPARPPRDAVVDARELGTLAVGVARVPGEATVTILGPDGTAANGRRVQVDGKPARSCGAGCYRAPALAGPLRVRIGGRAIIFDLPARAPDGRALLARIAHAYRSSRTMVFDERIASSPTNSQVTRFVVVAPDRLSYNTRGGPAGIVIGTRRWDRDTPLGRWVPSQQTRLNVTQPFWQQASNVHLVAPGVLTFLDPSVPEWFRLNIAGTRLERVAMTAAAHFMADRYVGFDVPVTVSPPPSR
jgi:hypothetical protein